MAHAWLAMLSLKKFWQRGHSKSTFAQDTRVLTILAPCSSPLKNGFKGANGCKIRPIKHWTYEWECKRKNDKYVWDALDDTIQGAPDNTPGVAPKGELQYLYI